MGHYHYLVNLDTKQVIHPHEIGNGLKLCEQIGWEYSTSTALVMLLAASSAKGPRGGGDFLSAHPLIGAWAGNRIAFVGDYAKRRDIPGCNAKRIRTLAGAACQSGLVKPTCGWINISPQVRDMMSQEFGICYEGEGWLAIKQANKPSGLGHHGNCPANSVNADTVGPRADRPKAWTRT